MNVDEAQYIPWSFEINSSELSNLASAQPCSTSASRTGGNSEVSTQATNPAARMTLSPVQMSLLFFLSHFHYSPHGPGSPTSCLFLPVLPFPWSTWLILCFSDQDGHLSLSSERNESRWIWHYQQHLTESWLKWQPTEHFVWIYMHLELGDFPQDSCVYFLPYFNSNNLCFRIQWFRPKEKKKEKCSESSLRL